MSPELRAMLAEQEAMGERIHVELDLLEMVLWCDSVDTLGAGSAMPAPYFQEEE